MFELEHLSCPSCRSPIHERLREGVKFRCEVCRSEFDVMTDHVSRHIALVQSDEDAAPEPLGLPKGSIRATVSLAMAGSSWAMVVMGDDVPSALFSLILAVIGYYFGFRVKVKGAESRLHDPMAVSRNPLYLPGGVIRLILIGGFVIAGLLLALRQGFTGPGSVKYVEFFIIFAGLVLGHLAGRGMAKMRGSLVRDGLLHLSGAVVLIITLTLAYLFISGSHTQMSPAWISVLCAVVSFYFGSRS